MNCGISFEKKVKALGMAGCGSVWDGHYRLRGRDQRGKKLWEKVSHISCPRHMSDHWEAYEKFLPKEKHTASKKETFSVEGMNSLIRHFLARFRRKTRCYSKSVDMVINTLLLFQNREMAMTILS
jgi:insertion element IS1 protein InsB